MHNGIIFPKFERVPRRFVPLFPKIGDNLGSPDGDLYLNWKARQQDNPCLGTFAERNAKRERKEECGLADSSTLEKSNISSLKSLSSPPEFKIGDLVECLPVGFDPWQTNNCKSKIGMTAKIVAFENRIGHPCALLYDEIEKCWPLRALRHVAPVETKPPADEWQEIKSQNNNKKTICWWQRNNNKTIGVWHLIDGQWDWNGDDLKYPDWPTLKTAIQKASQK